MRETIEPSVFYVAKEHGQRTQEVRNSFSKRNKVNEVVLITTAGGGACGMGS